MRNIVFLMWRSDDLPTGNLAELRRMMDVNWLTLDPQPYPKAHQLILP
jgi:hypothetical protein